VWKELNTAGWYDVAARFRPDAAGQLAVLLYPSIEPELKWESESLRYFTSWLMTVVIVAVDFLFFRNEFSDDGEYRNRFDIHGLLLQIPQTSMSKAKARSRFFHARFAAWSMRFGLDEADPP